MPPPDLRAFSDRDLSHYARDLAYRIATLETRIESTAARRKRTIKIVRSTVLMGGGLVAATAVVGFCMGGTMAYLAATKLDGLAASVCFYGGQIVKHADVKPKCPTQMHFGDQDASIPMSDVDTIKQKRGGDTEIYVYAGAQHGFCCDERASFNAESAAVAWARTLRFLDKAMPA